MRKAWIMMNLILSMMILLSGISYAVEGPLSFSDVTEDDWYYEDLQYSLENGLVQGFEDASFRGGKSLTRAEFVTILGRIEKAEAVPTCMISDVDEDHWAYPYVSWAMKQGITNGIGKDYSGIRFDPSGDLTREQLAVFTMRYLRSKEVTKEMLPLDKDIVIRDYTAISAWAYPDMIPFSQAGLVIGKDGNKTTDRIITSDPSETVTRAEAMAVLTWIDQYLTGKSILPRHMKYRSVLAVSSSMIQIQIQKTESAITNENSTGNGSSEDEVMPELSEEDTNIEQIEESVQDKGEEEMKGYTQEDQGNTVLVDIPRPEKDASSVHFETIGFSSAEKAAEAKANGRRILEEDIPQVVLDRFMEEKWIIVICTEAEYNNRSSRPGSTGFVKTAEQLIYIKESGNNSATYAHEFGHFLDYYLHGCYGSEDTVEMYTLYNRQIGEVVVGKFNPVFIRMGRFGPEEYEIRGANYAMSSPEECFAESFCQYCIHPEQLREGCPEYYAYIEHCLNEI